MKSRKTLQQLIQVIVIMEAHTGDNKIAITTKPKTFHFDLAKNAG